MITITANMEVNEEVYDISVQSENPVTAAELMLQARKKLLVGLKEEKICVLLFTEVKLRSQASHK